MNSKRFGSPVLTDQGVPVPRKIETNTRSVFNTLFVSTAEDFTRADRGAEDGIPNHYVRQFGQDHDGELYILVNDKLLPKGETGAVLKIVPPSEGDGTGSEDEAESGSRTDDAGEGNGNGS